MKPPRWLLRLLWSAVILLALIGAAVALRRGKELVVPSEPRAFAGAANIDSGFARHPVLTAVHIIPGFLFMVLGPLQFVPRLRMRRPRLHRICGRVFVVCGLVIGISALTMSPQMAIGGANESAATLFFAIVFLFSLMKAFLHIRRRRFELHREWMIRAFAVGLAVATIRPIVGVFFATSRWTHLTPHDFFGTAFWLGFTAQSIAAEVWINYTRPRVRVTTG